MDERFAQDDYVAATQPKSILCLPIVHQGKVGAILYLENSLTRAAFTPERLEVMQILSAQAAISLESARLFERMRQEIVQRQRAEDALKLALAEVEQLKNRLEEENVYLRRELIANVSHDLRSPLASLRGYLETLLIKEDSLTPAQRRSYLEIAARQSEHLQTLIAELFDLASLDFQGYQIDSEPMHLGELAQDVLQRFQLEAEKKQVRLQSDICATACFVHADIGLIERALQNLLDNALAHSKAGGRIRLAVQPQADRVTVQVSDNGSGIPAADLPHVFERFYRVDKARTRSASHTGLGLAIVKRILELHQCEISVASDPIAGTTFSFALPVADAVRPTSAKAGVG
jgi:signal transduction histidine kinase